MFAHLANGELALQLSLVSPKVLSPFLSDGVWVPCRSKNVDDSVKLLFECTDTIGREQNLNTDDTTVLCLAAALDSPRWMAF